MSKFLNKCCQSVKCEKGMTQKFHSACLENCFFRCQVVEIERSFCLNSNHADPLTIHLIWVR